MNILGKISLGLLLFGMLAVRPGHGEIIDRILAVVDDAIVTLGDLEQEQRFQQIVPPENGPAVKDETRDKEIQAKLIQSLIERHLMIRQLQQFPGTAVSEKELDQAFRSLQQREGSAAKLNELLDHHQVTQEELRHRLSWQLQVAKFIDLRFRQFLVVRDEEVEAYYRQRLLAQLEQQGISERPPLAEVQSTISAIVREEKLLTELDQWLNDLRSTADIEIYY